MDIPIEISYKNVDISLPNEDGWMQNNKMEIIISNARAVVPLDIVPLRAYPADREEQGFGIMLDMTVGKTPKVMIMDDNMIFRKDPYPGLVDFLLDFRNLKPNYDYPVWDFGYHIKDDPPTVCNFLNQSPILSTLQTSLNLGDWHEIESYGEDNFKSDYPMYGSSSQETEVVVLYYNK